MWTRSGTILRRCYLLVALLAVGVATPVAAKSGDGRSSSALENLRDKALAYEHGEGVPKDLFRAATLYCSAARQGDAEAQFSLGWMYANGRGVAHDDDLAGYFFKLAATQGHEQAQKMLRFVGETKGTTPQCMRRPTAIVEVRGDYRAESYRAETEAQQKVLDLVSRVAPEYGISPRLVMAIIRAESNFEPLAVSPKNAQGLMQLIPETSARFNVKQPFDPEQNIRGGLSYLRWLLAYFKGQVALVAAAYNAGEGTVNRFHGVPPYPETQDYVKRIMSIFRNDEHPYDPEITAPSPELQNIRTANSS